MPCGPRPLRGKVNWSVCKNSGLKVTGSTPGVGECPAGGGRLMDTEEGDERIFVRLCVSFTCNRFLNQRVTYLMRAGIGCVNEEEE